MLEQRQIPNLFLSNKNLKKSQKNFFVSFIIILGVLLKQVQSSANLNYAEQGYIYNKNLFIQGAQAYVRFDIADIAENEYLYLELEFEKQNYQSFYPYMMFYFGDDCSKKYKNLVQTKEKEEITIDIQQWQVYKIAVQQDNINNSYSLSIYNTGSQSISISIIYVNKSNLDYPNVQFDSYDEIRESQKMTINLRKLDIKSYYDDAITYDIEPTILIGFFNPGFRTQALMKMEVEVKSSNNNYQDENDISHTQDALIIITQMQQQQMFQQRMPGKDGLRQITIDKFMPKVKQKRVLQLFINYKKIIG
ncbi:hypothetical protein PPERSA_03276 [Pseudocohnilembus persalinus]|uniref:Uncharacterized protein n=1 Tax=Pseudocohnilembus persalinus TaxID=266149 RepID=A0A0V0QYQ5_PSEPJ|nr:hypothetical protein PPERSA_03276 [Pseudocohnilembus persalinus]|eukprot:KRX07443.1 hypothetical protein PPERSA_03276 [Pseudocohnilembus persalinus]